MRRERFDKINVVPFIDIVLVLLVIVLATATFAKKKAFNIKVPESSLDQPLVEPKNITISVNVDGKFFYENEELTLKEFEEKLSKLDPTKDKISLQTDQKTEFQKFVNIYTLMQKNNFKEVSVITK
jgi:biopolymer transport protein ExbD